jgi:hypothetical protein
MIVSQAPSNKASSAQILADERNRTFNEFLNILGLNADNFQRKIYWTHYGKCYPGKLKGGDKVPTIYCADKYLETEFKSCEPKMVIGISRPASIYLYSNFIDADSLKSSIDFSSIRNNIYYFNNIIWLFIKHTASTAKWSKDSKDAEFIQNVLRPEVQKIMS